MTRWLAEYFVDGELYGSTYFFGKGVPSVGTLRGGYLYQIDGRTPGKPNAVKLYRKKMNGYQYTKAVKL